MTMFHEPVARYMTNEVEVLSASAPLSEVARRLADRRVSAVPLVSDDGAIIGVVSRSDLLHVGRFEAIEHGRGVALRLPGHAAIELVTRKPHVCAATTSLRDAAREMVQHRIHRLFVTEDGRPTGVISTLDLAAAVRDARPEITLGDIMKTPVITVPVNGTLEAACDMLDRAHVTGLVVVDERWPIGVFTQTEAIAARDLPSNTPIEDLHDPAIICMPVTTAAYRAAAQCAQLDVRRVVACRDRDAVGIVSGLDFARLVAG